MSADRIRRPDRPASKAGSRKGSGRGSGSGRFRIFLKYALIAGVIGTLMMGAIFYFAYKKTEIPDPNAAFQTQASFVYYKNGKAKLGQFADQNRESIPLGDIPPAMQAAAVAAEDRSFWTNKGIDPKGILRAAFSNAKGNSTQGASTITQQYVKILYLTQQRTLKRKVKEAFLSLKIQQEQSKQQILEGYLNTIYFGRGAYGVQAASRAYYGIDAKQLNVAQSAMLASILNSPNYLKPDKTAPGYNALLERYGYVLNGMTEGGDVDASSVDTSVLPGTIKARSGNQYEGQTGFMLTLVKNELLKLGFDEPTIDGGGLRVTTTFSKRAMAAAKDAVLKERPEGLKGLHVGVASVDVKTGGLIGFYAGQNYLESQLNYATRPAGSVGSTFKPFAVATALKEGFSLKDTFDGNSPYELPDGSDVQNQGEGLGEDQGSHISMLDAVRESVNTAMVDMTLAMDNGPRKIKATAHRMGIPTTADVEPVTGIALGSATIAPVDMANAYSTIANGGMHHAWYVVSQVRRASDDKVLYAAPKKLDRAIDEDIAADVSYAMQQVIKSGTGKKAAIGRPVAGKTGTATNAKGEVSSSWFVGFTPQVATAVMYVRGKGHEGLNDFLQPFYGGTYPALTWGATMRGILDGIDEEDFPPPANVDGEAPSSGHAPYTPPPPKPKPTPTPTPTPVVTPTPTPSPSPTCATDPTLCPQPEPNPTPTGKPCPIIGPCSTN